MKFKPEYLKSLLKFPEQLEIGKEILGKLEIINKQMLNNLSTKYQYVYENILHPLLRSDKLNMC